MIQRWQGRQADNFRWSGMWFVLQILFLKSVGLAKMSYYTFLSKKTKQDSAHCLLLNFLIGTEIYYASRYRKGPLFPYLPQRIALHGDTMAVWNPR